MGAKIFFIIAGVQDQNAKPVVIPVVGTLFGLSLLLNGILIFIILYGSRR